MFDNGIVPKNRSTSGSGLDKIAAPMEAMMTWTKAC